MLPVKQHCRIGAVQFEMSRKAAATVAKTDHGRSAESGLIKTGERQRQWPLAKGFRHSRNNRAHSRSQTRNSIVLDAAFCTITHTNQPSSLHHLTTESPGNYWLPSRAQITVFRGTTVPQVKTASPPSWLTMAIHNHSETSSTPMIFPSLSSASCSCRTFFNAHGIAHIQNKKRNLLENR